MPKPRKSLVSLDAIPYYHCVYHWLCIEDRLLELANIFAIDIAAYAVMSNYYHVVLHINREQALSWSEFEVIEHWQHLFKGSLLSQRFYQGEALSKAELNALSQQRPHKKTQFSALKCREHFECT